MMQPLVSVWITTFNRSELLHRAVNSVLEQTYTNLEVIIVDDFSCEDEYNKIISFNFPSNVKVIRNKENMGACYSRNVAINIASGELVTGLDDDDEFKKNRIEVLVGHYLKYGDTYSLYCSHSEIFNYFKNTIKKEKKFKKIITSDDMLKTNRVGSQALVTRARMLEVGSFDTELVASQDHDMWYRIVEAYGNGFKTVDSLYICHDDESLIRVSSKKIAGLRQFYSKHREKMSFTAKIYNLVRLMKMVLNKVF